MCWALGCFTTAPALPQEATARAGSAGLCLQYAPGFLTHEDQTERKGLECKCLISLSLGLLPISDWVPSDFFWAWGQDLFLC